MPVEVNFRYGPNEGSKLLHHLKTQKGITPDAEFLSNAYSRLIQSLQNYDTILNLNNTDNIRFKDLPIEQVKGVMRNVLRNLRPQLHVQYCDLNENELLEEICDINEL